MFSHVQKKQVNQNRVNYIFKLTFAAIYYVKSARIRSFSGPYLVRMRENTDQKTPNTDTFHAVIMYETVYYIEIFYIYLQLFMTIKPVVGGNALSLKNYSEIDPTE